MATGKRSFILYCNLIHTVRMLTDDEAGQLFKLLLGYVNDENPEPDSNVVGIAFEPIKQQLKDDLKKWEGESDKRSSAGRLGGIASGESRSKQTKQVLQKRSKRSKCLNGEANKKSLKQNEANEASGSKPKVVEANEADNGNGNGNENVIPIPQKKNKRKGDSLFKPPSREELNAQAEKIGLPEIEVDAFVDHYESNGWNVGKVSMKKWQNSLSGWKRRWIAKGDKNRSKTPDWRKQSRLMSVEEELKAIDHRSSHTATGRSLDPGDRDAFKMLRAERKELRIELKLSTK